MCRPILLFAVNSHHEVFRCRMASTEVIHACVHPLSVDHTPQP